MKMVFPHARVSRSFGELASDMNSLVDSLFSSVGSSASDNATFTPRMDIHELSDKYLVAFDVPGVKPEAIDIDVKDDELIVQGTRSTVVEMKDEGFYRIERWAGDFRRSLKLPRTVDRDQIDANYQDGVLVLTLPKSKANQARKINVRSSQDAPSTDAAAESGQPQSDGQ